MREHSFAFYSLAFFGIILFRYFLVAGGTYWLFYSLGKSPPEASKTNSWQAIRRDIKLSMLSTGVFALTAACVFCAYQTGMTRLYSDPYQYGLGYLGVSYGVVLVLQDTFFYFTHRLFHQPALFSWFHQGHHRSRYPTPWTSFAFDPLEAIVQCLFLIGVVFVMPLHIVTLIAVLMTMTVWAVLTHLGLEQLPALFPHHWLGRWLIGPAHHSLHHLKYTVHYGLYFTFWDRQFGTQDPNYECLMTDAKPDINA